MQLYDSRPYDATTQLLHPQNQNSTTVLQTIQSTSRLRGRLDYSQSKTCTCTRYLLILCIRVLEFSSPCYRILYRYVYRYQYTRLLVPVLVALFKIKNIRQQPRPTSSRSTQTYILHNLNCALLYNLNLIICDCKTLQIIKLLCELLHNKVRKV